jgi:hypothetical protein
MAAQPDRIREEIEQTRAELASDVDRLADKTSPKRIAERRWDGVKASVRRASDKVMGASQSAGQSTASGLSNAKDTVADKAQSAAHSVAQTARQAPATVTRQTQGNPLAVGLIAFGAGLLAASLLPSTDAERRAGEQLAERADEVVEPLKEKAAELGGDLKERAQEAAGEIKDTARDAVTSTKEQATESGRDAVDQTKESVTSKR